MNNREHCLKLKEILKLYPDVMMDEKRFRAILLDYYPEEKLIRNLLYLCVEEGIVNELSRNAEMDSGIFYSLEKRLVNAYGCKEEYAHLALCIWSSALLSENEFNDNEIEYTNELDNHGLDIEKQEIQYRYVDDEECKYLKEEMLLLEEDYSKKLDYRFALKEEMILRYEGIWYKGIWERSLEDDYYDDYDEFEVYYDGTYHDVILGDGDDKYKRKLKHTGTYNYEYEKEVLYAKFKMLENVVWSEGFDEENLGANFAYRSRPERRFAQWLFLGLDNSNIRDYLIWRTYFRKGNLWKNESFCYLYLFEMIAEIGDYSSESRIMQLIELYKKYEEDEEGYGEKLLGGEFVQDYAVLHHIKNHDDMIDEIVDAKLFYYRKCISGDYKYAYDAMVRKIDSTGRAFVHWMYYIFDDENAFPTEEMEKETERYMRAVLKKSLPKIEKVFKKNGLNFMDYFVGEIVERKTRRRAFVYSDDQVPVWSDSILKKVGYKDLTVDYIDREIKHKYGNICVKSEDGKTRILTRRRETGDGFLSLYIFELMMVLIEKSRGNKRKLPVKPKDGLLLLNNRTQSLETYLSEEQQEREKELKYIALYDDIERIIKKEAKAVMVDD